MSPYLCSCEDLRINFPDVVMHSVPKAGRDFFSYVESPAVDAV